MIFLHSTHPVHQIVVVTIFGVIALINGICMLNSKWRGKTDIVMGIISIAIGVFVLGMVVLSFFGVDI